MVEQYLKKMDTINYKNKTYLFFQNRSNVIKDDQRWSKVTKRYQNHAFDQFWSLLIIFDHLWSSLIMFDHFWKNDLFVFVVYCVHFFQILLNHQIFYNNWAWLCPHMIEIMQKICWTNNCLIKRKRACLINKHVDQTIAWSNNLHCLIKQIVDQTLVWSNNPCCLVNKDVVQPTVWSNNCLFKQFFDHAIWIFLIKQLLDQLFSFSNNLDCFIKQLFDQHVCWSNQRALFDQTI